MHNGYPALSCIALSPPIFVSQKIVWGLDKLCKGFCKYYSPLRQMKITKTNDSILRTDNPTYVCLRYFFASFEILSQESFHTFASFGRGSAVEGCACVIVQQCPDFLLI